MIMMLPDLFPASSVCSTCAEGFNAVQMWICCPFVLTSDLRKGVSLPAGTRCISLRPCNAWNEQRKWMSIFKPIFKCYKSQVHSQSKLQHSQVQYPDRRSWNSFSHFSHMLYFPQTCSQDGRGDIISLFHPHLWSLKKSSWQESMYWAVVLAFLGRVEFVFVTALCLWGHVWEHIHSVHCHLSCACVWFLWTWRFRLIKCNGRAPFVSIVHQLNWFFSVVLIHILPFLR